MVDFQSRDTRRGLDETSEEEPERSDDAVESEEERPADERVDEDDPKDDGEPATVAVLAAGADAEDSGAVADALEGAGYEVSGRNRRARDHDAIQSAVDEYVDRREVCAVVTVGGIGVGPTDRTVEAVRPLLTKSLPGFGEAFRRKWASSSGEPVLASRATAGVADDTPVFCLPGQENAATFAARKLVAPEAAAIHREAVGP